MSIPKWPNRYNDHAARERSELPTTESFSAPNIHRWRILNKIRKCCSGCFTSLKLVFKELFPVTKVSSQGQQPETQFMFLTWTLDPLASEMSPAVVPCPRRCSSEVFTWRPETSQPRLPNPAPPTPGPSQSAHRSLRLSQPVNFTHTRFMKQISPCVFCAACNSIPRNLIPSCATLN